MKSIIFLIIATLLMAQDIYHTKVSSQNKAAMENKKIKCRLICDKKVYKEQKIADAISFYKNSKNYTFKKRGF